MYGDTSDLTEAIATQEDRVYDQLWFDRPAYLHLFTVPVRAGRLTAS